MRTRYLLYLCLVVTLAACAPYGGYEEGYYGDYGYYGDDGDYCPYGYCYPSNYYPYPYYPYGYRHRNYGHGGWYGRHR